MNRVRVITANIQANMPVAAVLADLANLVPRKADVLAFQEIGGKVRATAMRVYLWAHGYAWVQFHGHNRESVPMAYRRCRFKLFDSGAWHLSDATHVGKAGAGPATLREKHATWMVLEERGTGRHGFFSNCHLAPSIRIPERGDLHSTQVAALAELATKNAHLPRCMSGDYNTQDPHRLQPLLDTGLHMGKDVVTHGHHSAIDRHLADVAGDRHVVPGHFHTDHHPLEGDFNA